MNNLLDYEVVSVKENKTILKDKTGLYYSLYRLDKNEYQAYIELMKSKYIKKDVYSYNDGNNYHVLFVNKINYSNMTLRLLSLYSPEFGISLF